MISRPIAAAAACLDLLHGLICGKPILVLGLAAAEDKLPLCIKGLLVVDSSSILCIILFVDACQYVLVLIE